MDDIKLIALEVLSEYPIKRAAFFGSAARGDMTTASDIDMLVEFLPDTRGILFFSLQADLEEAFNRPVDLITFDALENEAKEQFRNNVTHDARIIYEREN
ncbi:MAG: nucleotidyltransferase domain-containing protein [Eubacteriales bacterium]|nr:nucleotidyltransferase domain-containing protein [Eubacteriales bacterium]